MIKCFLLTVPPRGLLLVFVWAITNRFLCQEYYNRKGFYSILLQGVVDANGFFRSVNIGWQGSASDVRVWKNSSPYLRNSPESLHPSPRYIPEGTWFVGDKIYACDDILLPPYKIVAGPLSHSKARFNKRQSRARVSVECAFGKLKGRFRCLTRELEKSRHCYGNRRCVCGSSQLLHLQQRPTS